MPPQITVMAGKLGDIFWDLPPWIAYIPDFDLGCSIYVANPSDEEKEYALMARLSRDATVISEEALPVFGYTWFKVAPEDFIRLHGALRFNESNAELAVLLVEKDTEEIADSVSTRLVTPTLPPTWPGIPGASGFDWSSLLGMIMPIMAMGIMGIAIVSAAKPRGKREVIPSAEERKMLPSGR
mgnify:CR=1 FL=1